MLLSLPPTLLDVLFGFAAVALFSLLIFLGIAITYLSEASTEDHSRNRSWWLTVRGTRTAVAIISAMVAAAVFTMVATNGAMMTNNDYETAITLTDSLSDLTDPADAYYEKHGGYPGLATLYAESPELRREFIDSASGKLRYEAGDGSLYVELSGTDDNADQTYSITKRDGELIAKDCRANSQVCVEGSWMDGIRDPSG